MAIRRVNNATVLGNYVCAQWVPNTAYALGDRVVCRTSYGTTARRAYVYECTTAGTSHATTEPTWPTSGTVADNTVVWTTRNPNDGNWDNASCILFYVLDNSAAGDFIYIHNLHSEDVLSSGALTLNGSTTLNNPVKIICVDKADDSLSEGAVILYSVASNALYFERFGYSYGVTYQVTSSNIIFGDVSLSQPSFWIFEGSGTTTIFDLNGSGKYLQIGYGTGSLKSVASIINGSIDFANLNNYIMLSLYGILNWKGGSIKAANGITKLFDSGNLKFINIANVDLSEVGSGATATSLVDVADGSILGDILFTRCKIPSAAGFAVTAGTWVGSDKSRVRLHHCSSANKTYDFLESYYEGTIEDEITIVRSGGASDGTTPQSRKMISSANTIENINALQSPPIQSWTNSITEKTFSVECLIDSATNLQNDEVWMEFEYPVDDSSGLGGFTRDKCAMLGTPADKLAGVGTGNWNTGGMANPNSFKCAVTVTPGKPGPITARICLSKPSTTIYYDPIITES